MLLTDNNRFSVPEQAVTALMLLVVLLFAYLALRAAESVQRALGITGILVVSRVSDLILAALSVETILDGIRENFSLASKTEETPPENSGGVRLCGSKAVRY